MFLWLVELLEDLSGIPSTERCFPPRGATQKSGKIDAKRSRNALIKSAAQSQYDKNVNEKTIIL